MSRDTVIRAEGLGKKYLIRHQAQRERYTALRDVISSRVGGIRRQAATLFRTANAAPRTSISRNSTEEFWALKDIDFEVRRGEVVGIIGRNGAGKSTLLKILSRITEPSAGRVEIKGRVASLLEVGTGFHPELTGRENIYLNGAILGMDRAEIRRKFDEIVGFAEVEKFLDTPVKRYSSGMYVRLAFAIAAHLEPEILIVDEVLAVGDAQFQKKCLGKMGDVSQTGRTVLFVSHDMGNITKLCEHAILLDEGRIELQGDVITVVGRYQSSTIAEAGYADLSNRGDRSGSGDAQFESIELLNHSGRSSTFAFGSQMSIRTSIGVRKPLGDGHIAIAILSSDGIPVHTLENQNEGIVWQADAGKYLFQVTLEKVHLFPGSYVIDLWMGDFQRSRVDYIKSGIAFQVVQTSESGVAVTLHRRDGLVFTPSTWEYTPISKIRA